MSRKKNISKKIPNGRTFQTKDNYFYGAENYRKPNVRGHYRRVVVVDSNRKNELAVVKLTTSKKGKSISTYKKGKSRYRPFVFTKDFRNKPIKRNRYFIENNKTNDLGKHEVREIKRMCFKTAPRSLVKENRKVVRNLKNRK